MPEAWTPLGLRAPPETPLHADEYGREGIRKCAAGDLSRARPLSQEQQIIGAQAHGDAPTRRDRADRVERWCTRTDGSDEGGLRHVTQRLKTGLRFSNMACTASR